MNLDLLPEMLAAKFPGCEWTLRDDAIEWKDSNPVKLPEMPVILDMLADYEAEREADAKADDELFSAGMAALISSVTEPLPDRPLNPAKVRAAVGLLTLQMLSPRRVTLTRDQEKVLKSALMGIFQHIKK